MAKILIVGCGDVGSRLAQQLAVQGHEVHGLRRSHFSLEGVHSLTGDVTVPASLRFPAGLDYVFVLLAPGAAGTAGASSATGAVGASGISGAATASIVAGEAAYRRVYFEGTRNVFAALSGQQLRRLFWISSSSVYGQEDGGWVDENSPAEPASASARVLLESEALALQSGWPATIVRFAGLYGPGRLRLLRWVQEGRPVQAEPVSWTNRIHVEDGAGLLAFLLAQDAAGTSLENLYIGTDNEPAPQHEVLDWLVDHMALPRVPHIAKPEAGSNKRLSNKRISALGYRWRFPDYRAGYEDVLRKEEQAS